MKKTELEKAIAKLNHYSMEQFEKTAKQYISAISEGRMFCVIESVSRSGMSRNLKFVSAEKDTDGRNWFSNYYAFFRAMGYSPAKDSDSFRIGGCGMDMVFHTNYSIIHRLENLGYVTKEESEVLAQKTPVKF